MDSPNPGSDGSVIDVEPRQTRRTRGGGRPVASQSATPAATMTDGDDDTDGGAGTRAGPSDDDDGDDFQAPSTSTPRGRGRPRGRPRGSGRGGRGRGGGRHKVLSYNPRISELRRVPTDGAALDDPDSSAPTTMMVDKKEYTFQFDELQLPEDEAGNLKIDAKGNLLGGREFKARTFTSPYRADPEKVYMLSIDAARTCGYRDSLYFFRRNKELVKLSLANKEKDILIRDRRLNGTFKARSVTMIAVRNAFKLQGAKMIKDGKHVTDDYYEAPARAKCAEEGLEPGSLVGELPDPASLVESRNLNLSQAALASHRVPPNQPFYTPGGPTTHFPSNGLDPFSEAKGFAKRLTLTKAGFSQENWLARFASEASEKNGEMGRQRRERLEAIRQGFMWDGVEAPPPPVMNTKTELGNATAGLDEPVHPSLKGKEREPSVASTALTPTTTGGFPSRAPSVQPASSSLSLPPPVNGLDRSSGGASLPGPDPATRPVKRLRRVGPPLGVYEPETHIPQVHTITQPTWATFERVGSTPSYTSFDPSLVTRNPDDLPVSTAGTFSHVQAMGGNRVGNDSWALASVRYEMDLSEAVVRDRGVVLGYQQQ